MGVLSLPRTAMPRLAACALAAGGPGHAQPADATVSFSVGDDDRARIEVPSAADRYHVLYYRPTPEDATTEHAVAIQRGAEGSVVLSEPLRVGLGGAYRVETYLNAAPGDADGDGRDDLAESAPLNPGIPVAIEDGGGAIPDLATYQTLSYNGASVTGGAFRERDVEYIKFVVLDAGSEDQAVYFMNTNRWHYHQEFAQEVLGCHCSGDFYQGPHMTGYLAYHPHVVAPGGETGTFRYQPFRTWPHEIVARSA